jgi:hypothetical protein
MCAVVAFIIAMLLFGGQNSSSSRSSETPTKQPNGVNINNNQPQPPKSDGQGSGAVQQLPVTPAVAPKPAEHVPIVEPPVKVTKKDVIVGKSISRLVWVFEEQNVRSFDGFVKLNREQLASQSNFTLTTVNH